MQFFSKIRPLPERKQSYCSRFAQTVTDFADASHSESAKSTTTTVLYGIFSSENSYPCTVTKFFHILHSIPYFSYLDTSKDPCYHDGNLIRTSGSVVEYRLAKARVAGSNPVSCFFCCLFIHLTYIQIKILKTEMLHYYSTATSPFFSLTGNYLSCKRNDKFLIHTK